MPQYSYRCKSCEHVFDEVYRIDDRKIPETQPCPECGKQDVYQKVSTPMIAYSVAPGLKTSDNFNSRLKSIKSTAGQENTVGDSIR